MNETWTANRMLALLDGDIFLFKAAWGGNGLPLHKAEQILDSMVQEALEAVGATEYEFPIQGPGNYRKDISPEYKVHRKKQDPPIHLNGLREFAIEMYNGFIIEGKETDDYLGEVQTRSLENNKDSIIISTDKDLYTVPGSHYNPTRRNRTSITRLEADCNFWKQVITGDVADNIKGLKGYGPIRASKIINDHSNVDAYETIKQLYLENDKDEHEMETVADLVWIRRHEMPHWSYLLLDDSSK